MLKRTSSFLFHFLFCLSVSANTAAFGETKWNANLTAGVSSYSGPNRADKDFPNLSVGASLGRSIYEGFGIQAYALGSTGEILAFNIGVEPHFEMAYRHFQSQVGFKFGIGAADYIGERTFDHSTLSYGPSASVYYRIANQWALGPEVVWLHYPRPYRTSGSDLYWSFESYSALYVLFGARYSF